jgi:peptidoglycan/LPS O-acetylase OafA/YrhL
MLRYLPRGGATSSGRIAVGRVARAPAGSYAGGHADEGGVRLPYMPGLDGLRALAVIAVLLYHAGLPWIPGGFLGVEIFFVLSGYLITSLLLAEWRAKGFIEVKAFWLGRARRLLPALYLMVMVTLVYAVLFLPGEVAGLRSDTLAAFGYVTNWYLIFGHESYFEAVGRPSLLKHLWSLAVEEQFYLVWPVVFWLGISLGATR